MNASGLSLSLSLQPPARSQNICALLTRLLLPSPLAPTPLACHQAVPPLSSLAAVMMSESAPPPTDPVYSGEVPVILKLPEREDRHSTLTVDIVYSTTQPRNQKVLQIQLTDESDSYLLYTLDISEDEFHTIKTDQSILVDFPTFPSKFVELLRQCQASAASEEHPRFVASLSCLCGTPTFNVTESNPFRQLTHLSLRFVAGNDAAIKRHLAGRLADFKVSAARAH